LEAELWELNRQMYMVIACRSLGSSQLSCFLGKQEVWRYKLDGWESEDLCMMVAGLDLSMSSHLASGRRLSSLARRGWVERTAFVQVQ
jgi:hypothetical protein